MDDIKELLKWITDTKGVHYTLFSMAGVVVGWFLKCLKTKHEISKLKLDTIAKKMELTEKLQSARNKYMEKNNELENLLNAFIVSLRSKNEGECIKLRLELNSFFFNEYLHSFCDYIDISLDYYTNDRKHIKNTVLNEIVSFVKTIKKYLYTINSKNILKKLDVAEITISKESLSYFRCKLKENRFLGNILYFIIYKQHFNIKYIR